MTLKNYFRVMLELSEIIQDEKSMNILLNQIKMYSEGSHENIIIIKNRKFYFRPELNTRNVCLLIQNDGNYLNDRIDYLIDEEWEMNLDLSIMLNGLSVSYNVKKYEQVEATEWIDSNGLEERILNFEEVDNTICIIGPKPPNMFGYDMNDIRYKELIKLIVKKAELLVQRGKNIILTNGYIGGEVLGYEAGKKLKEIYPEVMNVIATPFLNVDGKWPIASKNKYKQMITEADAFIEIDKVTHYKYGDPEIYLKEKFIKKNDFNIDHASAFIVIKDYDCTTSSFIRSAELNEKYIDSFFYDEMALPFSF